MNSHPTNLGIRKAAVFVASLDRQAADLVLEQMSAQQAQLVRQAMVDLGDLNPQEQQRVVEDFRREGPAAPGEHLTGIEIDGHLARTLARQAPSEPAYHLADLRPAAPRFRFLRDAEAEKLVKILIAERPQVIALVLSHLPPEQAGNVLVRLAPAAQVDVIRRLVDLEETDPEILREVERGLETRLSEQVRMQRRRVAGLSAVAGILGASEQGVGMQILDNLASHDRQLAEKLGPDHFDFPDLLRLDLRTLAAVLGAAEPELIVLALVGAPPSWTDRLLSPVPDTEARRVRRELEHLGPIRLSDVEEARRQLAELARQLAITGKIELPRRSRVPALV